MSSHPKFWVILFHTNGAFHQTKFSLNMNFPKRRRVKPKTSGLISLGTTCLQKLVDTIYQYKESEEQEQVDQFMCQIPSALLGEFMKLYHYKCANNGKQAFQIALDVALHDSELEEVNICPGCGSQDAIDLKEIKECLIRSISANIKWNVPQKQYDLFLEEIRFGSDKQCNYGALRRRFELHFAGSSIAFPLKQFLSRHRCTIGSAGIVKGLALVQPVKQRKILELRREIMNQGVN